MNGRAVVARTTATRARITEFEYIIVGTRDEGGGERDGTYTLR